MLELPIPAAVDAERVLLGAILNDAEQLLTVTEILPPAQGSWFYEEANGLIFDVIGVNRTKVRKVSQLFKCHV